MPTTTPENYENWTKQDLIDYMEYYKEELANSNELVEKVKNEWKKDDIEWQLERVSYN